MFDELNNIKQYGSIGVIIVSILAIFISSLFFGVIYYVMDVTEDALRLTDCTIENNVLVGNCQELFNLSIYPFLALREILIWFSFFFIFALVIGLLIVGYQSGHSPVMMGVLIMVLVVLTYFGIELSNIYQAMLEVDLFRSMMTPFTVYNKIMIHFPLFVFFVSLFSVILGIVNWQKIRVNQSDGSDIY